MKVLLGIVAAGLMTATAAFGGALNKTEIPADAKWVAHLDLDVLCTAKFGDLLKTELTNGPARAKLDAVKVLFSFDPLTDLKSLTLYGCGAGKENAVVLVRGAFDQEKLLVLLRANDTYKQDNHNGHILHNWTDQKANMPAEPHWGSFAGKGLAIIAATRANLTAALDVLDGGKPCMTGAEPIGRLVPTEQGLLLLAATDGLPQGQDNQPQAVMLKNANGIRIALKEVAGVLQLNALIEGKTLEAATAIQQILQGLVSFVALNQNGDPALLKIAQSVKIALNGQSIELTAACAAENLMGLLKKAQAQQYGTGPAP